MGSFKLFSHAGSFLVMWVGGRGYNEFLFVWPNIFSTGKCTSPLRKLVIMHHHVIKKKESGKLFCHAVGPEKQCILFLWPYILCRLCLWTKKFKSYFSDQLTFTNIHGRTSHRFID